MPEAVFGRALRSIRRRFRIASTALSVAAGAITFCGVLAPLMTLPIAHADAIASAAAAGCVLAATVATYWWRRWTFREIVRRVERRVPTLDNLVITAHELLGSARRVHPAIHAALLHDAARRLDAVNPARVQPVGGALALCAIGLSAAAALALTMDFGPALTRPAAATPEVFPDRPGGFRVVVTPPAYSGRPPRTWLNPAEVTALEGSRVRIDAASDAGAVELALGETTVPLVPDGDVLTTEIVAERTAAVVLRRPAIRDGRGDQLLQLRVEPDRRPFVRIVEPGKDLIFGEPVSTVAVAIEARDDLALASVALRYTRVSGSGETFTFEEGEAPLAIERASAESWMARGRLVLPDMRLEEGDAVVYRAVARDARPGAEPASSESFLIEIGSPGGIAATGFAIPEERDRQALSQQMLIIKTEKLHAARGSMSAEALTEQARLLAIEQRMVRAEFVFMTGGEVADEVEEAAHSHELAEGRMENEGQVELLAAIREMSRAEARLNAADTAEALTFERAALRALQRAFDRRRYLLRTLPERTRIDPAQRLTGDRSGARPMARPDPETSRLAGAELRQALAAVAASAAAGRPLGATRAAEILAMAPDSEPLRKAIAEAAVAPEGEARDGALRALQRVLAELVRAQLAAPPVRGVAADPLAGRLAEQTRTEKGTR